MGMNPITLTIRLDTEQSQNERLKKAYDDYQQAYAALAMAIMGANLMSFDAAATKEEE